MTPEPRLLRRIDADTAEVEIDLPADHPAFAGHFPERPILPGVVQLDWAVRLASLAFDLSPQPACQVQVKFVQLVTPNQTLILRLNRTGETIRFEFRVGGAIASTGRFRFRS